MIKIKRIYESSSKDDGFRVLVDRLWPRGLKKEDANIDLWLKDIAPSTTLRKWFDHQPEKWVVFKNNYLEELATNKAVKVLMQAYQRYHNITLIYAAHDQKYNHALVLHIFLKKELEGFE